MQYLTFRHDHDSVTAICLNDKGEVLLQREYSYPPGALLYQFPGGKMEAGENPEMATRRELFEESGMKAHDFISLGWYYTNNRRSAEKMHVFLAKGAACEQKSGGDPEEDIASEWVAIGKLSQMICQGEITNFSVLAAWALFVNRSVGN